MGEQTTIVIIDANENSRKFARALLSEISWAKIDAEATDLIHGYEMVKQYKPAIVIMSLCPDTDRALKLAEKIIKDSPKTTIFVTAPEAKPEVIIRAMRAGAREFLSVPLNKDELLNAVRNANRRRNYRLMDEGNSGNVFTVFGVKGGVGTTTVAINLAVQIAKNPDRSVVLVDLNLQFGNAALFMNLPPKHSVVDVANNIEDLNPKSLKSLLPKHSSGVHVLTGTKRMEEAESIRANHLDQVFTLLKSTFDYIVVDVDDVLDELTLKVLEETDKIITVTTLDLPAIYNSRQCLDIFQRMGFDQDKVRLLINRKTANPSITLQDLEKSLDYPVSWKIPNQDYTTVLKAVNQGVPLSIIKPDSKLSLSFEYLAASLNGGAPAVNNGNNRSLKERILKKFLSKKGSEVVR